MTTSAAHAIALLAGILISLSATAQRSDAGAPPRTITDIVTLMQNAPRETRITTRAERIFSARPSAAGRDRIYFLIDRGAAHRQMDNLPQARRDLEEALSLAETGSGEELAALVYLDMVREELGDQRGREEVMDRLLARSPPGSGMRVYALGGHISRRAEFGDLRGARQMADAQSDAYRAVSEKSLFSPYRSNWSANYESGRGRIAFLEGRYAESVDAFRRAIEALNRLRDRVSAQNALARGYDIGTDTMRRSLSSALREQDLFVEAELVAREGIVLATQTYGPQSARAAMALEVLGSILLDQGRYAEAQTLSELALERFRSAGSAQTSALSLGSMARIGETLALQQRWAAADRIFAQRELELRRDPDRFPRLSGDDMYWALVLARLQQAERAVGMARKVFQMHETQYARGDYRAATARGILAVALAARGENDAALSEFRESLPILLDRERAEESGEGTAARRTLLLKWIIEGYMAVLAARGDAASIDEAFRIADIARSSGVQRALVASATRARFTDPELARMAREEQDLANRARSLSMIVAGLLARPPEQQLPSVVAAMQSDIDSARSERRRLRAAILPRFPDYAALLDPRSPTLEQTKNMLGEGEVLVSLYSAADRTYAWVVRASGASSFAQLPVGSDQLARMVGELRKALDPGEVDLARFPAFDTRLAHELYRTLLAPFHAQLEGASSIIFVPHGALGQLNLSLLVTRPAETSGPGSLPFGEYRQIAWLLRRSAVSQSPSVAALATSRGVPASPLQRLAFAGFGDPVFSASAGVGGTSRGFRLRNLAVARADGEGKAIASNLLEMLPQLPDTGDEIREIASVLGADSTRDVHLGSAATETEVKTGNLSRYRVLAFATHGLVPGDLDGLSEPALALSNPAVTGERDADGLLTLDEILPLKLDADWVILSACNTGAAEGQGSEAASGLGRAFFFAGARALLVSNWPVESVSARRLTTGIFRQQAALQGLSRVEALRRSMLELIDHGVAADATGQARYSYAHPLFWAPFSLIGDGR